MINIDLAIILFSSIFSFAVKNQFSQNKIWNEMWTANNKTVKHLSSLFLEMVHGFGSIEENSKGLLNNPQTGDGAVEKVTVVLIIHQSINTSSFT